MSLDKNLLRTVAIKDKENILPYVSTFNPTDPEIFKPITENMPILQEEETMRNFLSNYKIIKSKRQPYNLKRLLTKAKFMPNETCEVKKYTQPRCVQPLPSSFRRNFFQIQPWNELQSARRYDM